MTATIITIVILVFYIIPIIYNKWWMKQAYYSKNGRWNRLRPENGDWVSILTPFGNLICAIHNLFDSPFIKTKKETNKPRLIERFIKF